MFDFESFHARYETDVSEVVIRDRAFRLFIPKYLEPFMDTQDPLYDFPLWSKIWEASLVLADHLAGMPPDAGRRLLEIGGGVGLVSVVGACFGHDMTMTEINPHALAFARANAYANGCVDLKIVALDWNKPSLHGAFDMIVGSEVVYHERDFEPLLKFFKSYLRPGGEIYLSQGIRKTSMAFLAQMEGHFLLKAQRKVLRSKGKEVTVILCRMT